LFRYFKYFNRYIFYINDFFSKKKNLELLFDYSKSGNGYGREIHRDSDSRYLVFLLYLNNLDTGALGGELDIYKLRSQNTEKKLAQPDKNNCELVESITPKTGRLVIFLNDETSYHAVKKMENSKTYRYFLYGGFTLLAAKNPLLKETNKMKTNFDLYL
jgi:Rps23 Pro-64 3,4-dihydroxylase Tpa1-like proline 4-hydroxylase